MLFGPEIPAGARSELTVHIPELYVTRIRVGLQMMGGKKVSSPNQQKPDSIIVTGDEWEPGILEISAYWISGSEIYQTFHVITW